MANEHIFDKVTELRDKFKHFFTHKKKLTALENFSNTTAFQHKDYLILIKRCMADGFLGDEEAKFLCYMIDKYFSDQNFLDWTHKTKWLKNEINRLSGHYRKPVYVQEDMFDWDKVNSFQTANVPIELLNQQNQQQIRRV